MNYVAKVGALRAPLAGLDPLPPRRLPDPPRRVRRGLDGDGSPDRRARRHRLHLPRGHPDPQRRSGEPKRGVGRLALQTGAPVIPAAVLGTEHVRRGWRIRPRKVRVRLGKAMTFPRAEDPSPALAETVTARIWPNVELQWEDLGGLPPMRRAAVIGAGSWGTAVAVLLARGGLEVQLGTRTAAQAAELIEAAARTAATSRACALPETRCGVRQASEIELAGLDLVCLAIPSKLAAAGGRGDCRPGRRRARRAAADQGPDRAAGPAARRIRRRACARPGDRLPRRPRPRARGRLRLRRPRPRFRRPRSARPARRGFRPRRPGLRALRAT